MTTLRKVLLGIAVVVAAGAVFAWRNIAYQVDVGAGFVAKQICGCIFIAGRSLESCRPDLLPAMDRILAEVTESPPRVRGYVQLFASRTATYDPATGCTLD